MGIENIKSVLEFVFLLINQVINIDSNDNGKVSFTEALSIATTLSFKFPAVQKSLPKFTEELKELDDKEISELVKWWKANFDLDITNDKVEMLVNEVVQTLHYNYTQFRQFQLILKAK